MSSGICFFSCIDMCLILFWFRTTQSCRHQALLSSGWVSIEKKLLFAPGKQSRQHQAKLHIIGLWWPRAKGPTVSLLSKGWWPKASLFCGTQLISISMTRKTSTVTVWRLRLPNLAFYFFFEHHYLDFFH